MAGWINMPLGMEVGLGPGDFVLDGDPALPPQKGSRAPIFRLCLLCPNGGMYQDATWYGGGPQPKRHCVKWGPTSPSQKGEQSPQFSTHIYCGQTVVWIKMKLSMEVGLSPVHIVLDGDPAHPP